MKTHIIHIAIALILGITLGASLTTCHHKKTQQDPEPVIQTDTLIIRDTLRLKGETKFTTNWDTLVIRDTDTVYITLPMEHKRYTDTLVNTDTSHLSIDIHYSGFHAKLDSVRAEYNFITKPQTQTITKENGWGPSVVLGAGGGYGLNVQRDGTLGHSPQVGIYLILGWGYHWKTKPTKQHTPL